ncbi:MAG: hypothetical protein LBD46_06520 [Endomicrobium sp.]|jgi:hypothetical protein|nr:hypothetical protein [Endomicrobium sp.]
MNDFKTFLLIFFIGIIFGAAMCGGAIYTFSNAGGQIERDTQRLEVRTQQQLGIVQRELDAQRIAESADIRARESTQRISELTDAIYAGADSAFRHIDELEEINHKIQDCVMRSSGSNSGNGD